MSSYVDEKNRQPVGFPTTLHPEPILDIRKIADRKMLIFKKEADSGQGFLQVPFVDFDGRFVPVHYEDWIVDLDTTGINDIGKVGGLIDGQSLTSIKRYALWAFADENYNPKGFGISSSPTSVAIVPAGANKGTSVILTNIDDAYRFVIGSRVIVTNIARTVWNNATLTSINSASSVTVLLDNGSYGYNLGAGVNIMGQWDKFRPYKPGLPENVLWHPRFKLLNYFLLDGSSNFIDHKLLLPPIEENNTPIGTIVALHKNLVGYTSIPLGWWLCDGSEIQRDRSPLIGQVAPDLNGEGRFLRGSITSGTDELATIVHNRLEDDTVVCCTRNGTAVKNGDGNVIDTIDETKSSTGMITTDTVDSNFTKVRPVNMSVVWIIKVL